ncbi:MAG: nicotinate-nucleotide adenylyltransferase [Chitinophagaceae bacterium]|nr:nicotinate-nucleotide adenylyltransferase [Chitinophagaceae bacterium]
MKIGLYFGSFNPIHVGHLIIANHCATQTDLDKVWFVVSPQNPFKNSNTLLNEYHRLHMVNSAIEDAPKLKASSVEFKLPKPSYTIDTLTYLKEKYPQHSFCIIMGSDSFQNLDKWKNYKLLIKNHPLYIYKRPGFEINNTIGATIVPLEAPLLDISSTHIRKLVKEKKSIRFLVPDAVEKEIESNNYYRG